MLTLSIRQPWAWAILHAGKDIENRTWPTRFRGQILIHAGKSMTHNEVEDFEIIRNIVDDATNLVNVALPRFNELPRGGIVGEVEIIGCVENASSPWFFGPYGFVLCNARSLPFRPCKGKLGFWEV